MNERTLKCLKLALDTRTPEAEAIAALVAARKDGFTWIQTRDAIIESAVLEYETSRRAEAKSDCQAIKNAASRIASTETTDSSPSFWFGKYKGKTIVEVYRVNQGYLWWVFENCDKVPTHFKRAIGALLKP